MKTFESEKVSFEVGTVDDFVAFHLDCKKAVDFPLVLRLKVTEALSIISGISTAIASIQKEETLQLVEVNHE